MKYFNILITLFIVPFITFAQDSTVAKTSIKYQANLNATFDKNIVQRLIIISNNRLVVENKWTRFEPTINYRFGFVQPNGRPKTDLENDLFIQIENHFFPKRKFFPAVIAGYENSPNLRMLDNRYLFGAGFGNYIFKKPTNSLQLNVYAGYESTVFKNSEYDVFRIIHTLKGRVTLTKNKFGLNYVANYAQSPNDFKNYRIRAFIKPYVKVTKNIDLNLMYDLWYENIIEETSPNEISTFTFGLSISNF